MITAADIRDILAADTADIGTLCLHPDVNKWSCCKPLRYSSTAFRPADGTAYRLDGSCGLLVPRVSRLSALLPLTPGAWRYLRPDGSTYPFRLGDFESYYHDALPPLDGFRVPPVISAADSAAFSLHLVEGAALRPGITDEPRALTLDDIAVDGTPLSQMYFGAAFFTAGRTHTLLYAAGSPTAGAHSITGITWPKNIPRPDTALVVPFLSLDHVEGTTADRPGTYIIPPGCGATDVRFGSTSEAAGITDFSVYGAMVRGFSAFGGEAPIARIDVDARVLSGIGAVYREAYIGIYKGSPDTVDAVKIADVFADAVTLSPNVAWKRIFKVFSRDFSQTVEAAPGYYVLFNLGAGIRRVSPIEYPISKR